MKLQTWHQRVLVGAGAVVIVMSGIPDQGPQVQNKLAQASELPRTPEPSSLPPVPRVELERLARPDAKPEAETTVGSAFNAISWYVPPPPPPPPKPVPPPPPSAPPMPFSYFGHYQDGGTLIILLLKGERMYTVSEGEVIESTYRVERLAAGRLELTYLPLNIKQTIMTGES